MTLSFSDDIYLKNPIVRIFVRNDVKSGEYCFSLQEMRELFFIGMYNLDIRASKYCRRHSYK